MAIENFLINPPKGLKRRRVRVKGRAKLTPREDYLAQARFIGRWKKETAKKYGWKSNPIGETLVTIGANPSTSNPWYGNSAGHRRAALVRWGKVRRRKRGGSMVRKRVARKRRSIAIPRRRRSIDRRTKGYRAQRVKDYRESASFLSMFTGKGKKRKYRHVSGQGYVRFRKNPFLGGLSMRKRRKSSRKRNTWFAQPRRHRKASKKGWRIGHMVPFSHARSSKRRRIRHRNPMVASANPRRRKSARRHYNVQHRRHRNPFGMGSGMVSKFTGTIMDVRHWAPLAITGGLSAITGAVVPGMLGVANPYAKYGVQIGVAVGGGMVVERVVGKEHGQAWMIVGMAMVGYSLLKEFVLQPYFPQFAVGLGNYEEYYPDSDSINANDVSQQVGAFPNAMNAFPSAMGAYPGVGEAGAYPYDGAGY